jgi:hypothetical protein
MPFRQFAGVLALLALGLAPASAQTSTGRVTGRVLDAINAQPLPGVTVQVAGRPTPVVTDLDGRYVLDLPPASALQRVTGASLVGGAFVFVRGLGECYSNTSLDGALIPSTEPERRVVSLNMSPAGLLCTCTNREAARHAASRPSSSLAFLSMTRRLVLLFVSWTALSTCGGTAPAASFQQTFPTREAAATAVTEAIWQRHVPRLESLALTEVEFRTNVWPHLPGQQARRQHARRLPLERHPHQEPRLSCRHTR